MHAQVYVQPYVGYLSKDQQILNGHVFKVTWFSYLVSR